MTPVLSPRPGASRRGHGGGRRLTAASLCRRALVPVWRLWLVLVLAGLPGIAAAHGAWLGLPKLDLSAATLAKVDANVLAGNGPVVAGDVVEVIAAVPTIVNGTVSGGGGWITFYVPNGTQVVGASVLNASLSPVPVRNATSAVTGDGLPKGWGDGGGQNTFNVTANGWTPSPLPAECTTYGYTAATCNAGMAFLYGDTGIFYSTRADTALYTGDGSTVSKYTNGYLITPTSTAPWGSIGGSGAARVHNKWDAVQSNAFGSNGPPSNPGFSTLESTKLAGGRGPTPYHAGSPVAGPDVASPLDRYGTTGPWRRISYPGSCIATKSAALGPANGKGSVAPEPVVNSYPTEVCTVTTAGHALGESNPLPAGTNAVRFAIGGIHQGETHRVMLRLRVQDPAAISVFNVAGSGGDASWSDVNKDNMWRYWVGAPANIPVAGQTHRLSVRKQIVKVNGVDYTGGTIPENATLRYRITYANTGPFLQTNLVLTDVLPTQTASYTNFAVVNGPNILPPTYTASTRTLTFPTIASLPALTGGAVEFDVKLNALDGAVVTNRAQLKSAELPTNLVSDATVTVGRVTANVAVTKSVQIWDPQGLGLLAIPGNDVLYSIEVKNLGSAIDASTLDIVDPLPAGLVFYRGAVDQTTTEPVKFVNGATASGLTCCTSAHISYSTDGGTTYSYLPPAGYDPAITHVRVKPAGTMTGGGSSFQVQFRARIK